MPFTTREELERWARRYRPTPEFLVSFALGGAWGAVTVLLALVWLAWRKP